MEIKIKKSKPGAKPKHDASLMRKVCEELLTGQITVSEITRKYNLGKNSASRWLRKYQNEQAELVNSLSMAHEPGQVDSSEKDKKELEKELALAKAKIATLETMIDIAEEQFNIEIRKKSGTKPSLE